MLTRRPVTVWYSFAASSVSSTDQRVLIGTSSERSSSSGACRDSASVRGSPSPLSLRIAGTRPTVDTVMLRADIPMPSGTGAISWRIVPMTAL